MIQIYGVPLKMMWKNFILVAINQGRSDREQIVQRSVGDKKSRPLLQRNTIPPPPHTHTCSVRVQMTHSVRKIRHELLSRQPLAMALADRRFTCQSFLGYRPPFSWKQTLVTLSESSVWPPTPWPSCTQSWALGSQVQLRHILLCSLFFHKKNGL